LKVIKQNKTMAPLIIRLTLLSPFLVLTVFSSISFSNSKISGEQVVSTNEISNKADRLAELGKQQFTNGQTKEAIQTLMEVLKIRRSLNQKQEEAVALSNIGFVLETIGESQKALEAYKDALKIYQFFNNYDGQAISLNNIGAMYDALGEKQKALEFLSQALPFYKLIKDSRGTAITLNNIGAIYYSSGEKKKALDYFLEAQLLYKLIKDSRAEANTLSNIGDIYNTLGENQSALDSYVVALKLYELIQDKAEQVVTLNKIGTINNALGARHAALDYHNQALNLSKLVRDLSAEATSLLRIGDVYSELGEKQKALDNFSQALALYKSVQYLKGEASTLTRIGAIYSSFSEWEKALNYFKQALQLQKKTNDQEGEASTLANIGTVFDELGEKQKALDFYFQAQILFKFLQDPRGQAVILINIGSVYSAFGENQKALNYYNQALPLYEFLQDLRGQSATLISIGSVYSAFGENQKALNYYNQALPLYRRIQDPRGVANTLSNMGVAYNALGEKKKALECYSQALPLVRALGNRVGEIVILDNLGLTVAQQNRPELSIFFLKLAVSITQSIRHDISGLPKATRKSYLGSKEEIYRTLASYLLIQGRILESQEILDLLKIEELETYFRGDLRGVSTEARVIFLRQEQQILDKYNLNLKNAVEVGQELQQLQTLSRSSQKLTLTQQKRLKELNHLLTDINSQFDDFINSPEVKNSLSQLSIAKQEPIPLVSFDKVRKNLHDLGKGALIYPLILENRIELIITTSDAPPLRRTVNVSRADLYRAILDYRDALQYPSLDPKPAANKLYRWLILPLEADLKKAGIKTLLYSPDGPLRYIPLAALYDGKQWIAERFAINNITAVSLSDLTLSKSSPPRVLAGAFANPSLTYKVQVGMQEPTIFRGLPFAGKEVNDIATIIPKTDKRIDQQFSLKSLMPHFSSYNILHFATHAAFYPGSPEDSFILAGDGERATLRSIEEWSLKNVDLVVLSACESGLGVNASPSNPKPDLSKLDNGISILGIGYQFQQSGARATIASLWSVDDGGTQSLMSAFYTLLQKGNITKVEALRQAQVQLISGKVTSKSGIKNLNHPHYWGSFFLIGNGL
jgi:CHAT domain-containing protein/Flp pilus assembly protein TadD